MAFKGHLKLFLCNVFIKYIEKLIAGGRLPLGNKLLESIVLDAIYSTTKTILEEQSSV